VSNQATTRKSDQSEVTISGRLANQITGKKNQSESRIQKRNNQSTPSIQSLRSIKSRDKRAETHTYSDMSRKAKDQTQALNIPFTLMTQGDLVQEALAVAKAQTQALNIPIKVPI
jgi:hypothetical protein